MELTFITVGSGTCTLCKAWASELRTMHIGTLLSQGALENYPQELCLNCVKMFKNIWDESLEIVKNGD